MSMAFTLASKLSPSTLFLFAPSPPKLPQVPTLAELQKQAAGIQQSIQESLPTYSFRAPMSSTEPKTIDGQSRGGERTSGLTGGSPPSYPGSEDKRRLRKPSSWRRIQDEIPGEGRKMDGNSVYAQSSKRNVSLLVQSVASWLMHSAGDADR